MAFGATCLLLLAVLLTAVHIGSSEAYAGATRSTISHTILVPLMMANAPDAEGTSELPTPQPNTKRDFKLLSIGLLSFDGGGIKGVLSTRLMAYALKVSLDRAKQWPEGGTGPRPRRKVAETHGQLCGGLRTLLRQHVDCLGAATRFHED